jgi:DNA-binding NtrC family response regulator
MSEHPRSNTTILIVAENGTLVGDLQTLLASQQYAWQQAKQAREALEILNSMTSPTDVTIIDLEFPGGLALMGHLLHRVPKLTKVIAVSSFFDSSFLSRLKQMGVDEAVHNPASPQAWRKTIASVLNLKENHIATVA